ncbi:MAG: DUF3800 domain-containing protein [Candidatus Falkowbacteria bacterium]
MLYKVFIDDSGSKDYVSPYTRDFINNPPAFDNYEKFWRDNYFVLCGVRIEQGNLDEINNIINRLKKDCFNTDKVELKSDWFRNPHKRKKNYLDKYKVEIKDLKKMMDGIYDMISNHSDKLKLIATVFDKRYYGDNKRKIGEGNPLAKTSQIIFERLQYLGTYHVVIFDQMESSLKVDKGNNGKILKVLQNNEEMEKIFVQSYDKIADIKFIKSCNENFLQIADLCAYNVYRQFVHYGREWSGSKKDKDGESIMGMYEYFNRIRCNFVHLPIGVEKKVCGVGMVCIPDFDKCNWNLMKDCNIK